MDVIKYEATVVKKIPNYSTYVHVLVGCKRAECLRFLETCKLWKHFMSLT